MSVPRNKGSYGRSTATMTRLKVCGVHRWCVGRTVGRWT